MLFRLYFSSMPNYIRLTRFIKCMGELEYGHLQNGIVRRIIIEAVLTKKLEKMNCNSMNFWIQAIENDDDRVEMFSYWQDTCENPDTYDESGNKKEAAENTDNA